MKINGSIEVPDQAIEDFCKKWKITEFALFGSVLRDDFRPDSDIDVLVRFERPVPWGLFDLAHMEEELAGIFGRKVDLIDRIAIEESPNYIRRRAILGSAKTVYAA
jgi:predicted nucleotidyltransferase